MSAFVKFAPEKSDQTSPKQRLQVFCSLVIFLKARDVINLQRKFQFATHLGSRLKDARRNSEKLRRSSGEAPEKLRRSSGEAPEKLWGSLDRL